MFRCASGHIKVLLLCTYCCLAPFVNAMNACTRSKPFQSSFYMCEGHIVRKMFLKGSTPGVKETVVGSYWPGRVLPELEIVGV